MTARNHRPGAASLRFLGAAGTVTGSRFVVSAPDGPAMLVDCGMYQGRREARRRNWAPFPVSPTSLDAVVLVALDGAGLAWDLVLPLEPVFPLVLIFVE